MTHVGDRAFELVLGLLEDGEAADLERHAADCAACADEIARAADDAALLASAEAPIEPSAAVKARLDASLESFAERLAHLLDPLAKMADLGREAMKDVVRALDDVATWLPGPGDGILVAHVPNGPAVEGAICGFIRLAPGDSFPEHTHLGEETVLVVQGSYRDSDGEVVRAGDMRQRAEGTSHSLTALDGPDLIYLAVVHAGIDLTGDVIDHEDPRI
jgi:putative transcriptional regulator